MLTLLSVTGGDCGSACHDPVTVLDEHCACFDSTVYGCSKRDGTTRVAFRDKNVSAQPLRWTAVRCESFNHSHPPLCMHGQQIESNTMDCFVLYKVIGGIGPCNPHQMHHVSKL